MTTRRTLLASVPLAILIGCSSTSGGATPTQIMADIQNGVAAAVQSFDAVVKQNPGVINPTAQAQIEGYLSSASSVLSSLSSSMSATAAAPMIQQIEQDLNAVVMVTAGLPAIPPPFSAAVGALAIVLPIIEAWVNSVIPAAPAASRAAVAARAKMATAGMSVPAAEAKLAGLAHAS